MSAQMWQLSVKTHFDISTWEAEAGISLTSQPGFQREFQDNQGYTKKLSLEKKIKEEKKKPVIVLCVCV